VNKGILLKCVACGYESKIFNVAIIGSRNGAFEYAAQCPLCESKIIKHVSQHGEPELEIFITVDNKLKISKKELSKK